MKRGLLTFLVAVALLAPARAQDNNSDRRADDEAFVQKLLEIIEKSVQQAEDTALEKTSPGDLAGADREAYSEITRRLDSQRVSLNFDGTPFLEAIDFFRDVTSLNIVLSRKARDLVEGAAPIKLKIKDVKVRNALELLISQTDSQLRYGFRHGVLEIGLSEDWKGKNNVIDLIPIEDIIYRPPDFPAPEAGLEMLKGNKLRGSR